jgi:hypothetical protein
MARLITAAGTKVSIGSAIETDDVDAVADLSALSYTQIGLVESIGEYGDSAGQVTFTALSDSRVRKGKGAYDAGTISLVVGNRSNDAGQAALVAAVATNFTYAIKIEFPDKLNPTGTNSFDYFVALVRGKRKNVGDVNNVIRRTFELDIDSQIYEVPATAGS